MWPGYQNKTFVTRKQCVIAAIEKQLQELKKQYPQRKIGLVLFNNDVFVVGDGCNNNNSFIITGDKLNKEDDIINESTQKADQVLQKPISESSE